MNNSNGENGAGESMTSSFPLGKRYRIKMYDYSKLKSLYRLLWNFPVVLAILHLVLLVLMIVLPWTFQRDEGFWTRTRSPNLDYTVIYFYVGCAVQVILIVITSFVVSPRTKFGSAGINSLEWRKTDQTSYLARVRSFIYVYIGWSVLLILGAFVIELFLWNVFTTDTYKGVPIGGPFSGDNPAFDYRYDQTAVVVGLIVGALSIITTAIMSAALGILNAFDKFPWKNETFFVREEAGLYEDIGDLWLFSASVQTDQLMQYDARNPLSAQMRSRQTSSSSLPPTPPQRQEDPQIQQQSQSNAQFLIENNNNNISYDSFHHQQPTTNVALSKANYVSQSQSSHDDKAISSNSGNNNHSNVITLRGNKTSGSSVGGFDFDL